MEIKDSCLRAYGILTNCAQVSGEEFTKLCSRLKLGVCLGWYSADGIGWVDDLMIEMKPSNLNLSAGRALSPAERDAFRADCASRRIREKVARG